MVFMNVSEEQQVNFIDDLDEQLEEHFPKKGMMKGIAHHLAELESMGIDQRVEAINTIRLMISVIFLLLISGR